MDNNKTTDTTTMTEREIMSGFRELKIYVPDGYSHDGVEIQYDTDDSTGEIDKNTAYIMLRVYDPRSIGMQKYSQLLQKVAPDGTSMYLTQSQIEKILEERGIWTDKEQKRYDEKTTMIDTLIEQMRKIKASQDKIALQMAHDPHASRKKLQNKLDALDKERLDLENKYNILWEQRQKLDSIRSNMLLNSIETLVQSEKLRFWAMKLVCYNKPPYRPFWADRDAFDNESAVVINQVIGKANLFWNGVDEAFFAELPEGATSNSDGNTVNTQEAPSSEQSAAPKT